MVSMLDTSTNPMASFVWMMIAFRSSGKLQQPNQQNVYAALEFFADPPDIGIFIPDPRSQ